MLNYIIGGLILQFVNSNRLLLFLLLFAIGLSAAVVLLFIHQPRRLVREAKKTYRFHVLDTLRLFADKRVLLLIPSFLFSGLSATFYYGILAAEPYTTSHVSLMGYCLVSLGVSEVVFSFAAGFAADRMGRYKVFVFGAGLLIYGGLIVAFFASPERYYLFFIAYALLGGGDATVNIVVYSTLASYFPLQLPSAFAFLRLIIAFGTALGFLLSSLVLTADLFEYVLAATMAAAIVCTSILHFFVASLEGLPVVIDIEDEK